MPARRPRPTLSGEQRARVTEVFMAHEPRMSKLSRVYAASLDSEAEAEDFMQDARIKAFMSIENKIAANEDMPNEEWPRYLAEIPKTMRINAARAAKRTPAPLMLDEQHDFGIHDQYAHLHDGFWQLAVEPLAEHENWRKMFLLYHRHGLEYEHIARALKIPLGTVRSGLNRARALVAASPHAEELAYLAREIARANRRIEGRNGGE